MFANQQGGSQVQAELARYRKYWHHVQSAWAEPNWTEPNWTGLSLTEQDLIGSHVSWTQPENWAELNQESTQITEMYLFEKIFQRGSQVQFEPTVALDSYAVEAKQADDCFTGMKQTSYHGELITEDWGLANILPVTSIRIEYQRSAKDIPALTIIVW